MKQLVLALLVLGLVCAARGASASDTEERPVLFEVDMTCTKPPCETDDFYFEVYPGDSIAFIWTARDPAPADELVTTDANDDLYPLFGGTGTYTVPGIYTIPPYVPEGTYAAASVSGFLRGRVLRLRRK
jgi:hypothetical protein